MEIDKIIDIEEKLMKRELEKVYSSRIYRHYLEEIKENDWEKVERGNVIVESRYKTHLLYPICLAAIQYTETQLKIKADRYRIVFIDWDNTEDGIDNPVASWHHETKDIVFINMFWARVPQDIMCYLVHELAHKLMSILNPGAIDHDHELIYYLAVDATYKFYEFVNDIINLSESIEINRRQEEYD